MTTISNTVLVTRGEAEQRTVDQITRCAIAGRAPRAVLCADNHVGYSQPIGAAIGYRDYIAPSGVGYDIGCGNKAVRTKIVTDDVAGDVPRLMDEIFERVSFGVGRKNAEPVDDHVIDQIREAKFAPQRQLVDMAAQQLGTVGSGNHYVDLFAGDDGYLWIGVHFGSRGFGHKTASGFLALAAGGTFESRAHDGEMDSPPVLLELASELGASYIEAMQLAGDYAYAGRNAVVDKVLQILGTEADYEVHNHHNFAWQEEHFGEQLWVVRKGCTPAFPGQQGFVGATMGEHSVILEGVDGPEAEENLYSTVHGAGRVMSRTAAAGKWRKRWTCCNRDCDWWQGANEHKPADDKCPKCGHDRLDKIQQQLAGGAVNWPQALAVLAARGIELRGGGADEAPPAYKRLDDVLMHHGRSIKVLHRLKPIGVAMAGNDVFDPYKD